MLGCEVLGKTVGYVMRVNKRQLLQKQKLFVCLAKQTNDNRCRNRNYLVECLPPARLAAPTCCYSCSAALGSLCCLSRLLLLLLLCCSFGSAALSPCSSRLLLSLRLLLSRSLAYFLTPGGTRTSLSARGCKFKSCWGLFFAGHFLLI